MANTYPRGSEWRIWDLQVQTILDDDYVQLGKYSDELKRDEPGLWANYVAMVGGETNALLFDSKEYFHNGKIPQKERCNNYAQNLFAFVKTFCPQLGLIGFTDHNYYDSDLLETLARLGPKYGVPCLTGVEINTSGVHMLVYFDVPPLRQDTISQGIKAFLGAIGVHKPKDKNGVLTLASKSIAEVLKIIDEQNGLMIFPHCNTSNGLFQERPKTDSTYLANVFNFNDVTFLQSASKKAVESVVEIISARKEHLTSRPIYSIASDSRKLLDIGKPDPAGMYFWAKANPTFKGFRQIFVEPDRAFIGDEPALLKRVRTDSKKFVSSLKVSKVDGEEIDDVWFDDLTLEFNSGLVAIIGNKGSGKSAITDVLCLCGETKQDNFSFLTTDKFRKRVPVNLSEKFSAEVTYADGSTSETKTLDLDPDVFEPERIKYIPQNFLEHLCTVVEVEEFEHKLKDIIYSHTPQEKRLGKETLDKLIDYNSQSIVEEIDLLKIAISKVNSEISSLERSRKPENRRVVETSLKVRKEELTLLAARQPQRPATASMENAAPKLQEQLDMLRGRIHETEELIDGKKRSQGVLNLTHAELKKALEIVKALEREIGRNLAPGSELQTLLNNHGIDVNSVIRFSANTSEIQSLLENTLTSMSSVAAELEPNQPGSLPHVLNGLSTTLRSVQNELDRPAREEQKYLDDLKEWNLKVKEVQGDKDIDGTIKNLESRLDFIDKKLPDLLESKYETRRDLTKQLFEKKIRLQEIRRELFEPLTKFIVGLDDLRAKYDVQIYVSLQLENFAERFFDIINQARIGTFSGREEGMKQLSNIIQSTSFDTQEGFVTFTDKLLDALKNDKRGKEEAPVEIETLLRRGYEIQDLYDFIYHFDYLRPVYNLKLGNKSLRELSPGERGALLLIFYLILDTDDIPLVIDQPEENLDNESVYNILVHFIKQVKERRQIFIVTHNPNLAIVCDADQIIEMNIEKDKKNRVAYRSGAIEDETMNVIAVNILEGTMAALNNRYLKYHKVKN